MATVIKTTLFELFKWSYNILARTPLRRVPGMLDISNVFFRALWPKGNVIEVQGNKMYVNVNDPNPALRKTFQAYGMSLVHEETTTRLFRQIVRPGDVILDLGANIGYFTLLAARSVGTAGKVFSFEPEPRNFWYLQKNVEVNGFPNVFPFQKAVSNRNGVTPLYVCSYDSGHHTINQFGGIEVIARGRKFEQQTIEIDVVRIDDFLKDKVDHVNVIKMDVEGAEALAIEGMRETLACNNIKMFMEYFPVLMRKMGSDPRSHIDNLLNDFGFTVYAVGHDYDLQDATQDLIEIKSFDQLDGMLLHEQDHVNLYLTK